MYKISLGQWDGIRNMNRRGVSLQGKKYCKEVMFDLNLKG